LDLSYLIVNNKVIKATTTVNTKPVSGRFKKPNKIDIIKETTK